MRIETIKIKNYKVFQDVTSPRLTGLNVFTGESGSGKSTFLDVLDFVCESMITNVATAVRNRGGLSRLKSQNSPEQDIEIELHLTIKKETSSSYNELIYTIRIGEEDKEVIVKRETLKQYSHQMDSERILIDVTDGFGSVANKKDGLTENLLFELEDRSKLSIGMVGGIRSYPGVNVLKKLFSDWHLMDFQDSKQLPEEQLTEWTRQLKEQAPSTFEALIGKVQKVIPELVDVIPTTTIDGRSILQFKERGADTPFTTSLVAEGQKRLWAYLLLLHLPDPALVLGVEAPESNLHGSVLNLLAEEFRAYTNRGGQLFVTSYSPAFMDTLRLEELFKIEKKGGKSRIQAAKDDHIVKKGYEVGDSLGRLWD
jgi:predicted ATPase